MYKLSCFIPEGKVSLITGLLEGEAIKFHVDWDDAETGDASSLRRRSPRGEGPKYPSRDALSSNPGTVEFKFAEILKTQKSGATLNRAVLKSAFQKVGGNTTSEGSLSACVSRMVRFSVLKKAGKGVWTKT